MRSLSRSAAAGGLAFLCALACAGITGDASAESAQFRLTSPAFAAGGSIPTRFTCEGGNTSPPLAWSDPPPGTKSFALFVYDVDAPDPKAPVKPWVHWVVYAIPADARSLDEGASRKLPPGLRHGRNDWKSDDYGGPCPAVGRHHYVHRLLALDIPPSNLGSPPHLALMSRIKPNILGKAEIIGTYEKAPAAGKTP
jgi:Raf kinase inhibitor-like YbhB/YbcL family protein